MAHESGGLPGICYIECVGLGGSIFKLALSTLFAVAVSGATNLRAQDPRAGSWTLVSAQSSLTPPNKLSITANHDQVHVVMAGETHVDFTANSGGHGTPVSGNPAFNQVELRKVDKKQSEVLEKKDGVLVATVHEKLSSDGNELTTTTATKGHPDQITVWTRSGGAKVPQNPFAGEWTEDMSKTRLRQGLILKIEPDGSGGVRFSGEYSYTARLDGKPYDLRNGRNDTVTLRVVDPHTVDDHQLRDDQPAQEDRWTVSADGQQMTLTSNGTLESGQHLTEKLVFKKQ